MLKFRVWSIINKKYLNPDDVAITASGNIINYFIADEWINLEKENFIIKKYLGIKDCFEREIYEGDIIKHSTGKYIQNYQDNTLPVWQPGISDILVEVTDKFYFDKLYSIQKNTIVVVGNILENFNILTNT